MASTARELTVKVNGDTSGFERSMGQAAAAAEGLEQDLRDIDDLQVSPKVRLDRINRDMANLNKVLGTIERQKLEAPVGMDLAGLTRDERRVRAELAKLEKEKVDIEVDLDTGDLGRLGRLSGALDDLDAKTQGMVPGLNRASGALRTLTAALSSPAGVAAGALAVAAGLQVAVVNMAKWAAQAEQVKATFATLTGSELVSGALFESLARYADTTPFALDEVTAAAKRLLAAGESLTDIPDTISQLGDISAAAGVSIDRVATAYTQMTAKGKISAEEMNQLAEAGINGWQALSRATGRSVADLQELASQGKLTRADIDALWDTLGQDFTGAVASQADTLNGKLSTLSDSVDRLKRELGETFLNTGKDTVDTATSITDGIGALTAALSDLNDRWGVADIAMSAFDNTLGRLGRFLGATWSAIGEGISTLAGGTNDLNDAVGASGLVLNDATGKWEYMGSVIAATADEITAVTTAMDSLNSTFAASEDASDRAAAAMKTYAETAKKQGGFTRETKAALRDLVEAHYAHVDAMVADGASVGEVTRANSKFKEGLDKVTKAAGLSEGKVNDYVDAMGGVPDDKVTVMAFKDAAARGDIKTMKALIDDIPRSITTTASVRFQIQNPGVYNKVQRLVTSGAWATGGGAYTPAAAAGGPRWSGGAASIVVQAVDPMITAREIEQKLTGYRVVAGRAVDQARAAAW